MTRISKYLYIFKLVVMLWRFSPFVTSLWLTAPILAGLTVIPVLNAQRDIIDIAISHSSLLSVAQVMAAASIPVLFFAVSALSLQLMNSFRAVISTLLIEIGTKHIQMDIADKAVKVDYQKYDETEFYDMMSRAKAAAGNDIVGILNDFVQTVQLIVTFVGLTIVLQQGHWLFPAYALFSFLIPFIVRLKVEIDIRKLNREMTEGGRFADYIRDQLFQSNTLRETKLYSASDHLLRKWKKAITFQHSRRYDARKKEIKIGGVLSIFQTTVVFFALYFLIQRVDHGSITIGVTVIVIMALFQGNGIAGQLSWPMSRLYVKANKVKDLVDFINMQDGKENFRFEERKLDRIDSITFKNVSFVYSNGVPVLKNINLTIQHGEKIALVGENGAGKTTFIKLLLRFYEPTSGEILVNGTNIDRFDPNTYLEKVSAVFQDFAKFELSMRENVGFGNIKKMYDDDLIMEQLQKFGGKCGDIDQNLGRIAEGGRDLSGGQWQSIAFARAMIRDSGLIIMDEPTAAIDPSAEVDLYNQFMSVSKGKTSILISHRLGWARNADRIVVLHQGEIIECGAHEELMENKGRYYESYRLQSSWYLDNEEGLLSQIYPKYQPKSEGS